VAINAAVFYTIGLKSPPYSKIAMILLAQKELLKGGDVDVKIKGADVY
jgi:Na+-transporting NADH:ubiquinone oxidoreductase subunit NqrF